MLLPKSTPADSCAVAPIHSQLFLFLTVPSLLSWTSTPCFHISLLLILWHEVVVVQLLSRA